MTRSSSRRLRASLLAVVSALTPARGVAAGTTADDQQAGRGIGRVGREAVCGSYDRVMSKSFGSRPSTGHVTQGYLLASSLVAALVVVLPANALGGSGAVGNIKVKATLDASREVPAQTHKVANATGVLSGTLTKTKKGYSFDWHLTYSKTSGTATFTNVQNTPSAKQHGTVIMFLCGPCKSGAKGTIYASPGEVSLLMGGKLYVNLTTKHNPAGEIRGQLVKTG